MFLTGFYEDFDEKLIPHTIDAFILSGGNVDVLFSIYGPLLKSNVMKESFEDPILSEVISVQKEVDSDTQTVDIQFTPPNKGIYGFCVDNRKARFLPKSIQLDIVPTSMAVDPVGLNYTPIKKKSKEAKSKGKEDKEEVIEVEQQKLIGTIKSLNLIHKGITHIQLQQQRDRHRLSLHSETNKSNYNKVFYGSIIETFVFIGVSIFQIFFVRRWFASKAPPGKAKSWA
eukprot:gene6237-8592_t